MTRYPFSVLALLLLGANPTSASPVPSDLPLAKRVEMAQVTIEKLGALAQEEEDHTLLAQWANWRNYGPWRNFGWRNGGWRNYGPWGNWRNFVPWRNWRNFVPWRNWRNIYW